MTTVTVFAGESGAMTEVVFGAPGEPAGEAEGHGDGAPSPYDYLLMALGA